MNPELANKTFANILEEVNRASEEFAAFGRAHKKSAEKPAEGKHTASDVTAESEASEFKTTIDIEKLRASNPDDPMIDLIAATQEQSKLLFDQVQELKATPVNVAPEKQKALDQESKAVTQQIDGFFKADDLKAYTDFYGEVPKDSVDWVRLTPGQRANRWEVINKMDEMLAGAEVLGRAMEIDEAMRLSHLVVSEPLREKIIREDIKAKTEKRSKNITLEPASAASKESAKPSNETELLETTAKRLEKTFNS